jgi:hypothetical protein
MSTPSLPRWKPSHVLVVAFLVTHCGAAAGEPEASTSEMGGAAETPGDAGPEDGDAAVRAVDASVAAPEDAGVPATVDAGLTTPVADAGTADASVPVATPVPTCAANASTGDYCGGDKVDHALSSTLYRCSGPGTAVVKQACAHGCVVAPAGQDDYCRPAPDACPHAGLLTWGLAPAASDHLRCAGITSASQISQTIGNAAASAGTHAQDGTISGAAYCAATDIRVGGLTESQVHALVDRLTSQGFAAYYRNPGHDGWPSSEARHIHAIYAGVHMKVSLRAQVQDWLQGLNGLTSHTAYTFFHPSAAQHALVQSLFNQSN